MNHIHRPKNVMFVITSMPVGGAETLLVNMLHRFDPGRIQPSICCLKQKDELGEQIGNDFPIFSDLINGKFDVGVVRRLQNIFKQNDVDAVVTIGAGDKMFWGRLAARYARVPIILSALHSTGWPDGVGYMNRLLTRITSGFIAVAKSHGDYLIQHERFPEKKVFVIPNGVDTDRFQFDRVGRKRWRDRLQIPAECPVVGIVAALRPEKNHSMFVRAAGNVLKKLPNAHFVIVGDGPEREKIETLAKQLGIDQFVHFAGCTQDIPAVLSAFDLFALTSHNEASPVSIMEAMCCRRPVVATDVGSVSESVIHKKTGYLVPEGDLDATSNRWFDILTSKELAQSMGTSARQHILENSSLDSMTAGYTELIEHLYQGHFPAQGNYSVVTSTDLTGHPIS